MEHLKSQLAVEMEMTRERFYALLDSIPESDYSLPTDNPAWTVGDVLFHITLGPRALVLEIWMVLHAQGLFQFVLTHFPWKLFNQLNARFARQGSRTSLKRLAEAYEAGHAVIRSRLRRTRVVDLQKSVVYPADFVPELAGEVSVERLFHYVNDHFEMHEKAIRRK